MGYTDVWDVTAPLDTQAANQGAVDFRATKLDIMQRVASFGAGTHAARPTPETTSGTADWTGVMYWETDTKKVFRWSGTAWVDITLSTPAGVLTKYQNLVPVPVTDDGAGHDGVIVILPANALVVGSIVKITGRATILSGGGTPISDISLQFNGTVIAVYPASGLAPGVFVVDQKFDFSAEFVVTGAMVQESFGFASQAPVGFPATGQSYGYGANCAADITGAITVLTHLNGGVASGDTVTFDSLTVEVT